MSVAATRCGMRSGPRPDDRRHARRRRGYLKGSMLGVLFGSLVVVHALGGCGGDRGPSPLAGDAGPASAGRGGTRQGAAGAGAVPPPEAAAIDCTIADDVGDEVTLGGLLRETFELEHLARVPAPAFKSAMASSHDPRSDHAEPGTKDWFANMDYAVLGEGEVLTLLEVSGPGALTRIWSATPGGTLRVYIDGAKQPTIEATMSELLAGLVAPFVAPFAFTAAGGHNLYFPIPFGHACRVTLTGSANTHYHVSYRTYDTGAVVEAFGPDAIAASVEARACAAAHLSALQPGDDREVERLSFDLSTLAPKSGASIEMVDGGLVRELRLLREQQDSRLLRTTVLSISFDGAETVRVPLGDFFGVGLEPGEVNSLPIEVDADGVLVSRWPMPFASEALIVLESTGKGELDAQLEVVVEPAPFTERSLLFNAQWHPPESVDAVHPHDWNLATIEGEGLYVGNVLNVVNRNPKWWGEGDEKIYVDDEPFPSFFGTGTEDYFGYAWCSNERFTTAYIGQTLAPERQNFGYTSLYRFHVLDPIPFQRTLRFDLEVDHWGDAPDMTYDAVSFWYARPGSRMAGAPAPAASLRVPELDAEQPSVAAGRYRCGG